MRILIASLLAALTAQLASAQIDLSGEWAPLFHEDQPERIPGPEIGDYLGLPITDAARMRADTWDASILTLPEHQCKPHPADYGPRGPANLRIWKEVDTATQRLIAWHTHISWQAPERTIYMDGRAHPPDYAAHTWQGFSTGRWEGDILVVTTTHLKNGWIRRNGVPRSDRATLVEYWIRHGDQFTLTSVVHDPVYLTEPFIRTTDFVLDPRQNIDPYPCEAVEEVVREKGVVPAHLPGTNEALKEFPEKHKIDASYARGGADTMYPGFKAPSKVNPPIAQPAPRDDGKIHTLPIRDGVYMLVGRGGNTTVQVGKDGVLVVDTKAAGASDDLLAAIKGLSDKPIRFVLNTSPAADHIAGNAAIAKAGSTITGGNVAGFTANWPATIVAHENVALRMSDAKADPAGVPLDTFYGESKDLYFNGEAVQLFHAPKATTDGDSLVFLRRSDVVAAGEIFVPDEYPVIDVARGGSIDGVVAALNHLLDITVPAEKQEGGTMVVPGRGRLCDEADVLEYRDMMTILRERLQDMAKRGMTVEQVVAAKPTRDYDPQYGVLNTAWTPDQFVAAAYRSLKK